MSAFKKKNVFVNPFYQDGVGRRTGIVVKKDVRKDSDGFEVFDDYWSESENDATMHTTLAAEKENKDGTMKKRSLRSMPSFTPQEASSDREASKVELPQDVSQAAENASALEADITGSIIKGRAPSLEPSSALSKFKTRQRLSFSEATTSEESQTSEGENSVGDEGESQESGSSSEGTVKAPSSQSELSQEEGDEQTETEEDDASGPVEHDDQQSSQTTSEPSSPQEEVPEPQAETTSSSEQGTTAQTRGSKRRSTRPDGDLSGPVPRETRSRKSISQSKNFVENEEMDEREAVKAVETRGRRSTRQSNASVLNENELQKDNEKSAKKGADTRRRKSTRQSKANEGKVDKDAVNDKEIDTNIKNSSRRSRSIKPSNVSVNKGNDIEIDLEKQEEKAGGTRRRKSTRQSKVNDAVDDIEIDTNTQNGSRRSRSLKPSNMSINKGSDTEMELEKQEERAGGTRRSKSTRQSNVSIKDVQEDIVGDKETDDVTSNLRKSPHQSSRLEREIKRIHDRSIRRSKGVEDLKDDVEKETEVVKSRRKSKQQSNAPPGKGVEEEKGGEEEDEGPEDEVAPETDAETAGEIEGEKVEGTKEEEVLETETEDEIVTETEEEEGERNIEEPESEEAVDTEEENVGKAIKQKDKTVLASKSDVVEDEDDDDTEKVFFSLRASFAVPSVLEAEDEFEFADADSQEYGLLDDTQKGNRKKSGRTNRKTIAKGGKKNDKEMVQKEKPEKLPKSTRRPTQKDKQESKMGKVQKKKASKRGSEIGRNDDQKKLKESPEESISGDGHDSKLVMGGKKNRGKKSNQQKKQLQRSQRSSESTSQASSSDADAGSQVDDDQAAAVDLPQKNQRKPRQKKPSNQKASSSDADAGSQVDDDQAAGVDLPQKNQRKRRQKKPSDHPSEATNSSKTASDETLGVDEDGSSTGKAGSSSSAFRSRRSSVHFTTKDMISVGGDISIHQVSSAEDKSSDNQKVPPTTATLSKDHKKSRRSSKGRSSGGRAKTRDEAKEDETRNVEEHLSGQSSHESTAESDRETADQGQSRRGRKKGNRKKPSKRQSSDATSTTSEGSLKTDEEDGVRRTKRHRAPPREYWHDSIQHTEDHTDTTQVLVAHHDANQNQSDQSIDQSTDQPTDQSPKGPTPPGKSPSTSSGGARSITSTGSILKVSRNWDKRPKNKKNKYSILYTEKPLRKAYIIKPDEEDGVRRTRRQRVRPLEYWRNERPLYERRKSGGLALAGIISPGAPEERVSVRSMRQPAKPKGHLPVTPSHISIHASPPVGTSKVCQPTINVVNPDTKQEVAIDAVATSKMLKFTGPSGLPAKPDDAITISKALSQKAFAAGILTIRPFGEKGSQLVRRDTMIFYVVRGKVAMTLHETSQILQSGDWFFVPKGNVYNITNLRRDEAKLTFFQLKSS
eukprot:XP_793941.3 PREDICTED: transcriptional regulator ATRX isoform X1 [Strongylocentrotus purpuratus]